MNIVIQISLQNSELDHELHYRLITETRHISAWDTGRRKRLYNEAFSSEEQAQHEFLFRQAWQWERGNLPKEGCTTMTPDTYAQWQKLAHFCYQLTRKEARP